MFRGFKELRNIFYRIGKFILYDKKRSAMGAHAALLERLCGGARVLLAKLFLAL